MAPAKTGARLVELCCGSGDGARPKPLYTRSFSSEPFRRFGCSLGGWTVFGRAPPKWKLNRLPPVADRAHAGRCTEQLDVAIAVGPQTPGAWRAKGSSACSIAGNNFVGPCCRSATKTTVRCAWMLASVCVTRGLVMRIIAFLAALSACVALGGCFFHHNQAVVSETLPPLK
jgi:hypothetical protein